MERKEQAILRAIKAALSLTPEAMVNVLPDGAHASVMEITGFTKGSGTKVTIRANFGPERVDNIGAVSLLLSQFAAIMPDTFAATGDKNLVQLKSGGMTSDVMIRANDTVAVPHALSGSDPILMRFPASSLKPLVCFRPDFTREATSVVHLDIAKWADGIKAGMVAVATNGHILTRAPVIMVSGGGTKAKEMATGCSVPLPAMQLAAKIAGILGKDQGIEMFTFDNIATMAIGGVNLSFNFWKATTLPWRQVRPEKSDHWVEVPAKQVAKSLNELAKVVGRTEPVAIDASHGQARLVQLIGPGEEGASTTMLDAFGTMAMGTNFGIQLQYWQQVIKSLSGTVRVTLPTTSGKPLTFSSTDNDDVEIVVMPKRA